MQEEPSAGGDWLRNQQQRATPRAGATQLHTGQQKAARRKYAPLYDSPADMEGSEEESSEADDEKNRALQEEQDMQDYNGEDEEDEPARPKKKKGTAVRRYTTVGAMCDPVLARLHARHVYIRGHPAAGVRLTNPCFPKHYAASASSIA